MAILLKTASVRVSSIQIIQFRVKTRAKLFGKVDMTETYQILTAYFLGGQQRCIGLRCGPIVFLLQVKVHGMT